jgi:cytochrome c oxidase subunit 2
MFLKLFYSLITILIVKNVVITDSPEVKQMSFQDPATPIMRGITDFHDHLMLFIVFIVFFVTYLLLMCLHTYSEKNNPNDPDTFTHSTILEVVWTILPALILAIVAVPSFALLYSMDEMVDPSLTIKVIGHQWYWSYEFTNYFEDPLTREEFINNLSVHFESYMISSEDIEEIIEDLCEEDEEESYEDNGLFRKLEVDKRLFLPAHTQIRILVSSADVLHSWAVPSFGIKIDACPGRLNQAQILISRFGTFYGQCSEICGLNHGFMPICISSESLEAFLNREE